MRVRQARGKLESSSSGCQTISLTSSACGQRSQSRGFEDRFLSSDRLASPSGASWFLASALLRFLSSPARFSSPTAVPPSSFEGHVSLRWLTLPHSAISSATTSLRTSWAGRPPLGPSRTDRHTSHQVLVQNDRIDRFDCHACVSKRTKFLYLVEPSGLREARVRVSE